MKLWHRRLGHLGQETVRALLTKDFATGVSFVGSFDKVRCVPCLVGP